MKEKLKSLQSSGETRKTNRTWHFLSTLNSLLLSKLLLLLIIPVMGSVNAWGSTPVTWTPSSSDITTLTSSTGANISVGTNADLFKVYAVRNAANNDTFESGEGLQFSDNSLYKSGIAVYVPTTSNDIESIQFYLRTTKVGRDPKYAVVDAIGLSSDPTSATLLTMTTSYASYSPFASPQKGKYYIVGGQYNGSGKVYLQKIVVTFASGVTKYAVTYNGNENTSGSTPSDATAYTYNDEVTVLGNTGSLAKTGYTFNGWNTEDDGTGSGYSAGDKFNITDDVTLYAQWTANNYTVTIDANEGTGGSPSVTATYGSALPSFTAPTKDGYTLTGYWTGTSDGTKIINANGSLVDDAPGYTEDGAWIYDGDKTLYAQWQEKTADKFHFKTRTSGSTTISANTSTDITEANGYASALSGGTMSFTTGKDASNINTSGVQFKNNAAYVTINLNSPLANGDVITVDADHGISFHATTSWSATPATSGGTYTVTAGDDLDGLLTFYVMRAEGTGTYLKELTITGSGSVSSYTVTYNGNDESTGEVPVDASSPYVAGTSVTVLGNTGSLTKDNYTFAGWNSTANGSGTKYAPGSNFTISNDVTLYAVWKHQVDLEVNNASMGSISATYATADSYYGKAINDAFTSGDLVSHDVQLTLTATPNTGYHFAGSWGSGTGATSNPATVPVGDNKNYIANFAPDTYTVTLDRNGGSADGSATATYNSGTLTDYSAATHATNTLTGYWTATSGGTKVINADGTLVANVAEYTTADGKWINTSDDVTLHAQWKEAVTLYTVTFSGNGHGTPASGTVTQTTQGGNITLPACPANTYYQFVGWSTSSTAAAADAGLTAGESYQPAANITLYAVYKWQLLSQVSPAGAGNVVMRYDGESGTEITSENNYIAKNQTVWVKATANPGYTFNTWSNGATASTNPISFNESELSSVSAKTMIANFTPKTYTVTLDLNGGTAGDENVTATYNAALPSFTLATLASNALTGYFTSDGTKVINADGTLKANVADYTDANGKWINTDANVTLYAHWEAAGSVVTSLPYTYDFTKASEEWDTSITVGTTAFPTKGNTLEDVTATDGHHIYFQGAEGEDKFISGPHLQVNSNGSTNHFIAIPVSGINGRLDVTVVAPYTSGFKVRAYLDTSNGTNVQSTSPGSLGAKTMEYTATNTFVYREKDLTATRGVLYISVNSSSYKLIDKIKVSTPDKYLVPTPAEVIMGDGETATVTIKNHSAQYKPVMKTGSDFPSYLDEDATTFNPSTGELVIVAKAIGKDETIKFALDTDGNGQATSTDLEIPVTVQGVTISASPSNAVYAYGANATSLSVSATQNDGGTLNYQWYRNTVNSTVGGTAISGATSASYTPSTTLAAEDASFYYCVVSSSKSTSLPKTSGVAYVLTSSTGRYFQMSNVAGNKSTLETSIEVTGQKIAGGVTTFYKGSDGDYVLRPTSFGHYFHLSSGAKFKVVLNKAIAAGDKISVKVQGLGDATSHGIWVSASDSRPGSTPSAGVLVTAESETEVTKTYTAVADDGLVGASTIYIYGANNTADYFTDLIIYTPGDVKITDPASQTIQSGEVPAPLTVTASDGSGIFSFQWQKKVGDGDWTNVTTPTDGTVDTDGATSTFQPIALTATTSYKCTVTDNTSSISDTSEAATITVTSLTHGWYTPASYTDNKATYLLTESNYNAQNSGSVTSNNHYWTKNTGVDFKELTIDGNKAKYARLKNTNTQNWSTFYVKGASAFTLRVGNNSERTYSITVDGENFGTFYANPDIETQSFALKESGSVIRIDNPSADLYLARLTFYDKQPATIIVKDADGVAITEATQYFADGAKEYSIESNSAGTIDQPTSSDTDVATVSYAGGVLTVTPGTKSGTTNITIHQQAAGDYAEATTTLVVTVQKYEVTMSFSYDKVVLKESEVNANTAISAVKLPTLTITHADGTENTATVNWDCDEKGLVTVVGTGTAAAPTFTATYRTGQGGARIFAYVEESGNYASAMAYFDLVVERGFSNNLPNSENIKVQQQYTLEDNSGNAAVVLTYGGYKYLSDTDKTKKWSKSAAKGKYFIDGYKYYTRNDDDALNEYDNQLKGMLDDPTDNSCPDGLWYKTTETRPQGGNYGEYERIRPFALPCKGGYLKFEPKQSGILTAYVWQNGVIGRGSGKANQIGSKPRLGYWFDQDGWVQHPVVDPVSKQPISNGNGRNTHVYNEENLDQQMTSQWLAKNDDAAIIPMLRSRYTNSEDPDINSSYSDTNIGYENPYWWPENADVINNNKQMIPRKMKPVPYHNGFMVPEESYVKYTINVVAGKTYYFYGMMTKVGYVGMNFVPDESVLTTGGNDIAHRTEPLHLQTNDDMTNISGITKNTIVDEVTLPSNYRAEKWNTICLPFALSENQVKEAFGEGTQLAIFNGLRHDAANHIYYVRYLRHVDANILPGQPYFIYPTGVDASGNPLATVDDVIGAAVEGQSDKARITFNNVFIDKDKLKQNCASYGSDKDADGSVSYVFTGTYAPSPIGKYDLYNAPKTGNLNRYMPANANATMTLNTYHAFIDVKSATMQQDGISFAFAEEDIENAWDPSEGGEPTKVIMIEDDGIREINRIATGKSYNMMGQQVDPTSAKGIILVDGKKVMY